MFFGISSWICSSSFPTSLRHDFIICECDSFEPENDSFKPEYDSFKPEYDCSKAQCDCSCKAENDYEQRNEQSNPRKREKSRTKIAN